MSNEQKLREIIRKLLDRVRDMDDCGPPGETWQSDELMAEIAEAEQALAMPTGKQSLQVEPAVNQQLTTEPVTLTDGQALKDAFEEGYCSRSTYNDVDTSDVETEWEKSSAKASIAALREKDGK